MVGFNILPCLYRDQDKKTRALAALHELRTIAHVIDMH
jgi:hypothetical protein